uniref:Glycosyltransferase family 32 protein n=1 Tax=Moniliophthora roreri TaxID=221103 RepID=A0A0W0EX54_MONRR
MPSSVHYRAPSYSVRGRRLSRAESPLPKYADDRKPPSLTSPPSPAPSLFSLNIPSILPKQLEFTSSPENPSLPPRSPIGDPHGTIGVGPKRVYLDMQSDAQNLAYPPRPRPGSVADLDIIMQHCDFSINRYVRDCLEILRVGAGLDNGKRVRRHIPEDWKYVFVEDSNHTSHHTSTSPYSPEVIQRQQQRRILVRSEHESAIPAQDFTKNRKAVWEPSPIQLPLVQQHGGGKTPGSGLHSYCDPTQPRIFHMFWTGDFTDKPYLAILSFLFTQNLGLHLSPDTSPASSGICAPKLWVWINPGYVFTLYNPNARQDMFASLEKNQWSAPFLHPRFKDIIQFQFWNTTEQLESVEELRGDWKKAKTIFNSGGYTIPVPDRAKNWPPPATTEGRKGNGETNDTEHDRESEGGIMETDKISVVLSDMARFIICHRFGGVYIDADTLFLRDWEELWGWRGAFAYRWSFHDNYNTAVLRLNKGSALGTFLLRTALKNGFDFHPMTITDYLRDAKMEELLFRLPDALFDSAWLNMEGYQRDRPPMPYFVRFEEFFETPAVDSAAPQVVGFDGFFKGAFSYHFHNSWSRLSDPSRNFPDLAPVMNTTTLPTVTQDRQDLDWSTVLKRTFEAYLRGERGNMYGEWIHW